MVYFFILAASITALSIHSDISHHHFVFCLNQTLLLVLPNKHQLLINTNQFIAVSALIATSIPNNPDQDRQQMPVKSYPTSQLLQKGINPHS
jgi:hypothetical protein